MPIEKVLDLTTAHMPSNDPGFGTIRVAPHEHGWVLFVGGINEMFADYDVAVAKYFKALIDRTWIMRSAASTDGMPRLNTPVRPLSGEPRWLLPILYAAVHHKCAFIVFDQDGCEHPNLPTYEW